MQIAVAGAGYVGLTTAACLCELGHTVRLVEIDPTRLEQLRRGECPFFEPNLPALLSRHLGQSLLVTDDLHSAVHDARMLFTCVGTPPLPSGAPDLSALWGLLKDLRSLRFPGEPPIVVMKSTVPPGTNRRAQRMLGRRFAVVSNPEFLREGTAITDFFRPDRIVIGGSSQQAVQAVADLYQTIKAPVVMTGWEEAETVKYATNAFLALKISFANEIAALAEAMGADGLAVLRGLGLDQRVGPRFLAPGPGFGGSCLPKDLSALRWKARRLGIRLDLLQAALRANAQQRRRVVTKLGAVAGKRVAVWGLAFKAGTDDVREAASLTIIPALLEQGAEVIAHDPEALLTFARACPPEEHPGLKLVTDPWEALRGADALLILTEWPVYRDAEPEAIRSTMAGNLLVDARNLLDPQRAAAAGLRYRGIGR
ncbi:MAG: UDP-glucose dehydrogenase family protein [Bacillota bacterium]